MYPDCSPDRGLRLPAVRPAVRERRIVLVPAGRHALSSEFYGKTDGKPNLRLGGT